MGKGVTKREKKARRLKNWADVLRELAARTGRVIKDLDDVIKAGTGGRKLAAGERAQVLSLLHQYVKHVTGGFEVIPSKLKSALDLLPAPAPTKVSVAKPHVVTDVAPEPKPISVDTPTVPEGAPHVPTASEVTSTDPTPARTFFISLAEAIALCEMCVNGALPKVFPSGSTGTLGRSLARAFEEMGFVTVSGSKRGTRLHTNASVFHRTKFKVIKKRGRKQARWEAIPEHAQKPRAAGDWFIDLKDQMGSPTPVTQPQAIVTPTVSVTDPAVLRVDILRTLEAHLTTCKEVFERTTEIARPHFVAMQVAERAMIEARKALADAQALIGIPPSP